VYHEVFPRCDVVGSLEPEPYGHLGLEGSVPRKCSSCTHIFEGSCLRAIKQLHKYLSLDHGPCPVCGPTNPVLVETATYKSKVFVPAKCERCRFLDLDSTSGFVCDLERKKWGAFPRTLDWGAWSPDHPIVGLKSGRSVTREVIEAVKNRKEAEAVKAFRLSHPGSTFLEARKAYAELIEQVPAGFSDKIDVGRN